MTGFHRRGRRPLSSIYERNTWHRLGVEDTNQVSVVIKE